MKIFLKQQNIFFILLFILILHFIISIYFFSGIYGSDDWLYAKSAITVSQGNLSILNSFGGNRIGLIFPTTLCIKLFGINEVAITIYPLVLSLLTIILVYKIGLLLFDKNIGLLSAFILATIPLQIVQTTQLLPNLALSFWLSLAIFIYLHPSNKLIKYKYFLTGLIIGIGYLHHITAGYLLIFITIYTLLKERSLKHFVHIAIGFLFIFLFESILFYSIGISNKIITLFSKYTETRSKYLPDEFSYSTNTYKILNHIFNPFWMTSFSIIPVITIFLNIFFLKKIKLKFNKDNYCFIVLWAIGILCFYLYFPNGFQFKPMTRVLSRYFSPILPPLAILTAIGIYSFAKKSKKILYIIISVIFLSSLFFLQVSMNNCQLGKIRRQIIQRSIKYIDEYDTKNIYCERKNIGQFSFFYYNQGYSFKRINDYYPDFKSNSIVIYDNYRISSWHKNIEKDFPNFLKTNTNYELLETVKIKKNFVWKIMDKIKPDGTDPDYYLGGYILYIN